MNISPDNIILWQWGFLHINATIAFTWLLMLLLVGGSALITRRLAYQQPPADDEISTWQNLLEILVVGLRDQIRSVSGQNPDPYLPFIGTLFVFVFAANLLIVVPGYQPPTGSLSTTTALAASVFIAVPVFGIAHEGIAKYLNQYIRPTPLMLPFNLIGELSRTMALAVRLYGNVMSGTVVVAILLTLMPFFFPIVMQLLGLITGTIQAYIFAVLATVYTASASSVQHREDGLKGMTRTTSKDHHQYLNHELTNDQSGETTHGKP